MSTWSDLKNNPRLKKIYEQRVQIIRLIREFFWSNDFLETDTPVAVRYPGQEPYLNPVPVEFHSPQGGGHKFYLHTSPEFALKKILAAGFPKIFYITKYFRDYENFGGQHNTEFTMIEWYRAPGALFQIMDDTENLFKHVAKRMNFKILRFKDFKIDCDQTWGRMTMKEVWKKYVNVDLDEYLSLENIKMLANKKGYPMFGGDAYEDVFYKIFLNEIEPKLGAEKPVFVYDYPSRMTSLSRICDNDPRYAERFELYIGGLELSNAFGELTDPDEQFKRIDEDRKKRETMGKTTWPVDPDFIEALRSGIPAKECIEAEAGLPAEALAKAGGIALGVDRLVLLFTGARDLNEVMFQSVKDQINV